MRTMISNNIETNLRHALLKDDIVAGGPSDSDRLEEVLMYGFNMNHSKFLFLLPFEQLHIGLN